MGEDLHLIGRKIGLAGGDLGPVVDEEEGTQELFADPHSEVPADHCDEGRAQA